MVALAPFQPRRDVDLVDLNRADEGERRRVERLREALDALVDHLVLHIDFGLKLAETRVKAKKRANREQPL